MRDWLMDYGRVPRWRTGIALIIMFIGGLIMGFSLAL